MTGLFSRSFGLMRDTSGSSGVAHYTLSRRAGPSRFVPTWFRQPWEENRPVNNRDIASVVSITQAYYDGPADEIYRTVWGDNLHLGVPRSEESSHPEAMEHTNEIMAAAAPLGSGVRVLDLGCGYGSTARYLATNFGCEVTGINISEKELQLARERSAESRLNHLLTFEYGDFHHLAYPDDSYDVVWSQESFLHAADKRAVLSECRRVLRPGGSLVFTDILVRRETPAADRAIIYDRVKSPDMWDFDDYRESLSNLGLTIGRAEDWSRHVARSYGWVRDRLRESRGSLLPRVGADTIDSTVAALSFWVDSAEAGYIGWAFFVAEKPG